MIGFFRYFCITHNCLCVCNQQASFIMVEFESRIETLEEMLDRNISLITVNEAASYLGETLSDLDRRIYARMSRDNASIPMRS